jgi:hypothetical protein
MYRLGLGCAPEKDLCLCWIKVAAAAFNCFDKTVVSTLLQDSSLLTNAAQYLPAGVVKDHNCIPLLIALYQQCDTTLQTYQQHARQQQEQQQQRPEDLRSRQDRDRDMLDCAVAATELFRLVMQALEVHPGVESEYFSTAELEHNKMVMLGLAVNSDKMGIGPPACKPSGVGMAQSTKRCLFFAQVTAVIANMSKTDLWFVVHNDADAQEMVFVMAKPMVLLLQLLRPVSASDFASGRSQSKAWLLSLSNIARQLPGLMTFEDDVNRPGTYWHGKGLRVLLEQVLPVLGFAAGLDQSISREQLPDGSQSSSGMDFASALPADCTLLLLDAAARVLGACVAAARTNKASHSLLTKGLDCASSSEHGQQGQAAAHVDDQNDLVTVLHAVQALACDLVTGGALWQQAKEQCPLLLIEVLDTVIQVSFSTVPDMMDCIHGCYSSLWRR